MNCPLCNHPVRHHGANRHEPCWDAENDTVCHCGLTEVKAQRAAQRAAAARHLWALKMRRDAFKNTTVGWRRLDDEIYSAIAVLRAVEIMRERKP